MTEADASQFTCRLCGGEEILIPENPSDDAVATCADCDSPVAKWGTLRPDIDGQAFRIVGDKPRGLIRMQRL